MPAAITLALVMSVLHALAMIDRSLLAAVAPLVRHELAIGLPVMGVLLGPAYAVGYGVATLAAGWAADRGAVRRLVIGGVTLWTAASAASALIDDVAGLFACRMLLGIGQAMFVPAAILTITAAPRDRDRTMSLSAFTTGSTLGRSIALLVAGGMIAALAAAGVAERDSWRALFAISAVPNILLIAVLLACPRLLPALPRTTISPTARAGWRRFALYLPIGVTPVLVVNAMSAWLPTIIADRFAVDTAAAAAFVGLTTLIGAPTGHLLGGWWMAARPADARAVPLVLTILMAVAAVGLAAFRWADMLVVAGGALVIVNIAAGCAAFVALFAVQGLAPPGAAGRANGGFLALVTLVASAGGPSLAALVAAARGSTGAALSDGLLVVAIGVVALLLSYGLAIRGSLAHSHRTAAA